MNNLNVTLVQFDPAWEDIRGNLARLSGLIAPVKDTGLVVLPEMFSTGFSMRTKLAETPEKSLAVRWLKKAAAEKNCVITGSVMIREKGKFFNRLIWMRPDGTFSSYDKRHLFSLSPEPEVYTPGKKRVIVELDNWRVCPLICYDLRFPVWSRNAADPARQYDLLIYVANWPETRREAWRHLLVARAIENQSWVVGVNRTGSDGNGLPYAGDSMVVDPAGTTIHHKPSAEEVVTLTLNGADLRKIRERFPFLKDGDARRPA